MTETSTPAVRHNEDARRFEIEIDGHRGVLDYERQDGVINFLHTKVPKEIGGRGIAGDLAAAGLKYAGDKDLKVIPTCPFVASYVKRHPKYHELLASRGQP